jgi:hypothetical protein
LNVGKIMNQVKLLYQNRLEKIIKTDPVLSENTLIDNNRITELI